jgi:hypothetical protein
VIGRPSVCPFINIQPSNNFHGKHNYGEQMSCCHIAFKFNSGCLENYALIEIL